MIRQRLLPYNLLLTPRDADDIDLLVIHCTELPDLAMAREYGERLLYPSGAPDPVTASQAGSSSATDPVTAADTRTGTGNSGHFYIDRDGSIEQWVGLDRVAHHVRGFNPRSIGVELVNLGRYPHWLHSQHQQMQENYPAQQIDALLQLISELRLELPGLRFIAGHAELDQGLVAAEDDASALVNRKLDPGPLFPWPQVIAQCGLQRLVPRTSRRPEPV